MDAETFAHNVFLVGFALTAIASVAYAALPLWPRVAYGTAATDSGTTVTVAAPGQTPIWLGPAATASAWLALAALTTSLVARWIAGGRPPLSNMWEFTVAFGWGVILFYVLFELRARWEGEGWPSARTVGAFVLPVALGMFAVSLAFFPSELSSLLPALQANRILGAHVTTMVLSYAALSVSFGAAVGYLIQGGGEGKRFARLPSGERLEEIANRSVLVGFPLLTLGVTLGAFWAYSAWGRYWGWDPKETSALVIWLVYAAYLHARNLRGWKGKGSAWLLVIGFGAVLFSYFAVNLWVSGLHSYSGV
ncbi:MAG: c-type cytochrome biogenesis protein CcsB [Chloroflexi bacterium]|nr:c-type cytochrome biogenesis protein CcsB [Chloroflexota bacterium]